MSVPVRQKTREDQAWIEATLAERWGGGGIIVVHGRTFDARTLPALVAGDREGLATYDRQAGEAELVTLHVLSPGRGVGTALIEALSSLLRAEAVTTFRVTTTNDNLDALRFYQRRGFRIAAVRPGAVNASRLIKPSIREIGEYGIAIRDEIDLVLSLSN